MICNNEEKHFKAVISFDPDILKYIDEFVNNNNWEHLDNICEKIANNDEVWYATNIEIYDYVTAYDSLIFSDDSTIPLY